MSSLTKLARVMPWLFCPPPTGAPLCTASFSLIPRAFSRIATSLSSGVRFPASTLLRVSFFTPMDFAKSSMESPFASLA